MEKITQSQTSRQGSLDYSIIRENNLEAKKRLKEAIPAWLKAGWILEPLIISTNKDGSKKSIFLTSDGRKGSPRISIKSVKDFPETANAILGRTKKYVVIDFDKPEYINKVKLPKPCLIVETGKGEHWYFHVGDIRRPYKLIFGEAQYDRTGVYIPGSFHAPSGKLYKIIQRTASNERLSFSHIKPYLKSEKDTQVNGLWEKGSRNNTLFKKVASDMQRNQGRTIPDIIKQAMKSGLDKEEVEKTTESAIKTAVKAGVEPEPPIPSPPGQDKQREKILFETINVDKEIEPAQWHVPNWLPRVGVVLLTSDKAVGKTAILYLIQKCLTSGVGLKGDFFKTEYPIKKTFFCYGERSPEHYARLWQAHKGANDTVMLWRWASEHKVKKTKAKNFTLKNLRYALEDNPDVKVVFLDRADLLVKENSQFSIRDSGFELDEIAHEHKCLFIATRHTSKPIGSDARKFQEQTSGFKEWQHTPSVCLFLHAHEKQIVLFKVYANECSRDGLIKFKWKNENGIYIPEYADHNDHLTIVEIEQMYNKQQTEGKREKKLKDIYEVFSKGVRCKAFRPGEQKQIPVFILSKESAVKILKMHERAIYRVLTEKLGGWSKNSDTGGALWHCPVK